MRESGITLIELLVTVAVVAILAVVLGSQFVGWKAQYGVESQMKEIYVDLMNARSRAMQRKRTHFFSLIDANTYTVYEDTDGRVPPLDGNGNLDNDGGANDDTELPSFPKRVDFELSWDQGLPISFSARGFAAPQGTLSVFIDRDGDGKQDFIPDFGCIDVSFTRINLGRYTKTGDTYDCEQR